MEKVISTLVWAAVIQGVLLAGLYLFSKKHQSLANRLLGLFLLVIIYEGVLAFLPYNRIFGYSIYYFSLPEVKLFYPVLFLHYILEKVGRTERYRTFLRSHYFLAITIAGISLIGIGLYLVTGNKIEDFIGIRNTEIGFMIQQYYAFLVIIVSLFLSVKEVNRYKQVIQKEYSDYEMLNINWLWQFILAILPIVLLWGAELIRILLGGRNSSEIILPLWGFVVVLIYFVSFQAFKHKNLFEGVADNPGVSEVGEPEKEKGKKGSSEPVFSAEEDEKLIREIRHHMETEEPYLDASLSMHQLAKQLNTPVRELSLLINHKLEKHFFDFVNEYRIKKAMEILKDPRKSKMTILEILYEVGFNSKSSFNTVFKKYTGKTPTEYRKSEVEA